MPYLTYARDIYAIIAKYTNAKTLWIDTEVADYKSRQPKLSLIQVLDDPSDMSGDRVYLLDVLGKPEIVGEFIDSIMLNPSIEKVFHNASYDLKFLGNKQAKNVTCTLEIAKKIPYYLLPVPNYQLQTLATVLCAFNNIDKEEQISDWGQRPLTDSQIDYAYLDCIYLAQVHLKLLELQSQTNPDPATEDLALLGARYTEIEQQHHILNSELEHLQERIKKAMQIQNVSETSYCKLTKYERKTVKVAFTELMRLVETAGIDLDFPIPLTQKLQKDLGTNLEQLSVEVDETTSWRLTPKSPESAAESD
ncbi:MULTISPECIES: 3'-5' exonuclease [unclassified Tolypothrix]|uniref:3'-5' exonuclease n=1 Tax=unclassified Tolypothrix TaxID=2649714 RepID=UPI0005EAAFE4|nr:MULTISPECIES: 3'-5' exonuclease [unclassified Tolypothrix]BAY89612.1 3'-5' exonuclease [Microchaete diplosiphon NIES-3275]EKF02597.1 exonuclease [Tolypothrix sp. PCC 7601]MBE9084768.1 ribonuclease D [Tolypothrix sp. LEGE 11397]UYD23883.1 ribonuclease D [Tolypothrix sp. PCC 7712]UYD33892.1 ribonuclease D [Tolypothrix sp. PCC 7601]